MRELMEWVRDYPEIEMISIWGLSTENLNRSEKELKHLWKIYNTELEKLLNSEEIRKNQIKIRVVGDSNSWNTDFKKTAKKIMKETENYTKTILNVMISYGSQFEILNAIKKVVKAGVKAVPPVRNAFVNYLMINRPVDLIIRTGGHQRLSNFLLYQAAYSEIYFSQKMWPDFSKREFNKIMKWFWKQKRNYGK